MATDESSAPWPAAAGTLPVRLQPGSDLRDALEALAPADGAFVVAGIGSLVNPVLRLAGTDHETHLAGPFEILSLAGTVTPQGAHLHVAVADLYGHVTGGHVARGNRVRTTVEVLLVGADGWRLGRTHDQQTGYFELTVERSGGPGDDR
jgi:predicted DNA-binding protein with PD1-like motif